MKRLPKYYQLFLVPMFFLHISLFLDLDARTSWLAFHLCTFLRDKISWFSLSFGPVEGKMDNPSKNIKAQIWKEAKIKCSEQKSHLYIAVVLPFYINRFIYKLQ